MKRRTLDDAVQLLGHPAPLFPQSPLTLLATRVPARCRLLQVLDRSADDLTRILPIRRHSHLPPALLRLVEQPLQPIHLGASLRDLDPVLDPVPIEPEEFFLCRNGRVPLPGRAEHAPPGGEVRRAGAKVVERRDERLALDVEEEGRRDRGEEVQAELGRDVVRLVDQFRIEAREEVLRRSRDRVHRQREYLHSASLHQCHCPQS